MFLGFSGSLGGGGESRLEGGRVLLEKSAEIQSVVRGLRGQIKGLEDRGCSGGRGGRRAGGVLRGATMKCKIQTLVSEEFRGCCKD